jgi:gentisate 1,2-dioxygenase
MTQQLQNHATAPAAPDEASQSEAVAGTPTPSVHDDVQHLREDAYKLNLIEFSEARPTFEFAEPPKTEAAHVWRWQDYYPMLQRAASLLEVDRTFRRSFMFSNPALFPKAAMTSTLDGACSWYNPGERARVHRHTPSASRLGLQGVGGFSTVEGEKCSIGEGDLVLTPAGNWHDFGNESDRPALFMDVVNDPLCLGLGATFYDIDYTEADPADSNLRVAKNVQTVVHPLNRSEALYSSGGLLPKHVRNTRGWSPGASPMYVYRFDQVKEALDRIREGFTEPHEGVVIEYVNPITGQPAMPTMSFHMQLLRPGETTGWLRSTASSACCAFEGHGTTAVGAQLLEWKEKDVFVLPKWTWYQHTNATDRDVFLFSASDEAAMRKLELYRAQHRTSNGEVIELVESFK